MVLYELINVVIKHLFVTLVGLRDRFSGSWLNQYRNEKDIQY